MALKLFDTMVRRKEVFEPLEEGKVSMYCCGPTVYHLAHIGNLRTMLMSDFLRRALEYNGFEVNHVMNITDVGHLSSDADEGEDKMEAGARREGKTVWEIAEEYTQAFIQDIESLNIKKPSNMPKATDHIKEMIDMVKTLEEKGFTYVANGNVYFDVSKFKYYRDLGKLNLEEMKSTDRVTEDTGKRNPQDFVLWFTNSKFEDHAMKWESPWGEGYPGWHIECSAMSSKYLGDQFDIHCGGVDLVQVHHTNEIAQSECCFDKHPWVKFWVHGEFILMGDDKMAKSDGNSVTIRTVQENGYDPLVYRYFCMGAHYRQKLNFNWEAMDHAKNAYEGIWKKVGELKGAIDWKDDYVHDASKLEELTTEKSDKVVEFEKKFTDALNDDINMPQAVAVLHEVLKSDLDAAEKLILIGNFDKVFGLKLLEAETKAVKDVDPELQTLLDKREEARKAGNWEEADEIRDELASKGYKISDGADGPVLEKN